jgi:hypothetical protein
VRQITKRQSVEAGCKDAGEYCLERSKVAEVLRQVVL